MEIDTGIGKNEILNDHVQYDSGFNYVDEAEHGTHVAGIILYGNKMKEPPKKTLDLTDEVCRQVKLFSCRFYTTAEAVSKQTAKEQTKKMVDCVKEATRKGFDYINFSGGGETFDEEEYFAYKEFTQNGGIAVVAMGNEGMDLSQVPYYPASYAFEEGFTEAQRKQVDIGGKHRFVPLHLYPVQNTDKNGVLRDKSNHDILALKARGSDIFSTLSNDRYAYKTGTSMAAPAVLHTLLNRRCKHIIFSR